VAWKSVIIILFALIFSASLVFARQRPIDSLFAMADTDRNGRISEAEWHVAMQKRFETIDTNRDGAVSREEMEKFRETMRGRFASGDMRF